MKKFTEQIFIIMAVAILIFSAGCQNAGDSGGAPTSASFSNLADDESRKEVGSKLEMAGISSDVAKGFWEDVALYNDVTQNTSLVKSGFEPFAGMPEYDIVEISTLWAKEYPVFIGYNCRITAFSILKDFITVGKTGTSDEKDLFMDLMALADAPRKVFAEEELEKFKAFFGTVQTEDSKDWKVHSEKWLQNWDNLGVEFTNAEASFISVVVHSALDGKNELFIGHCGVLIPMESGEVMFIEKLSFDMPYQAIIFKDRAGLVSYLMDMYDYGDAENAKPFVLENKDILSD